MGSQNVPYIYEDYVSIEDTAAAIFKMYSMSSDERASLSKKVEDYVSSEFALENTIDMWHESLFGLVEDWKAGKAVVNRFEIREL